MYTGESKNFDQMTGENPGSTTFSFFGSTVSEIGETQKKQAEFTRNMFNNINENFFNIQRNFINNSIGMFEKFVEGIRSNSENMFSISRSALKSYSESFPQEGAGSRTEPFAKMAGAWAKQLEVMEDLNAKILDSAQQQLEVTREFIVPLFEIPLRQTMAGTEIPRDTFTMMNDSYNKAFQSWINTSREISGELTRQANTLAQQNMKFWSAVFTPPSPNGQAKESATASTKKPAPEPMKKSKETVI